MEERKQGGLKQTRELKVPVYELKSVMVEVHEPPEEKEPELEAGLRSSASLRGDFLQSEFRTWVTIWSKETGGGRLKDECQWILIILFFNLQHSIKTGEPEGPAEDRESLPEQHPSEKQQLHEEHPSEKLQLLMPKEVSPSWNSLMVEAPTSPRSSLGVYAESLPSNPERYSLFSAQGWGAMAGCVRGAGQITPRLVLAIGS
uniref:Uncharacterized protein n=1 Tax=Pogona vitticeps TaxID=103695 RepID=A0ABM5EWB7_9SAUR